jgi:small-conductance mechanosensitive channel
MVNFIIENISRFAAPCQPKGDFLGFPTWYKYLEGRVETNPPGCAVVLSGLGDIWLILLAIIEMLIRLAAIAAVVYIVYSGIRLINARGNPEKITSARIAIQDALVGLVIAIIAIALISFIGGRIN